jgi:hypothetical protein
MPDLSSIANRRNVGRLVGEALAFMFGAPIRGVPPGSRSHAHYKNFVRLVDKAASEYEAARRALTRYVERDENALGHTIEIVVVQDHLENVFNAIARALSLLDLLKDEASITIVTGADRSHFQTDDIKGIRNAVEHFEAYLERGDIPPDGDVMIRPAAEGAEFAGVRVDYRTLARWITRLHEISTRLIEWDRAEAAAEARR